MNWIKKDWVNFRNLELSVLGLSLLLDIGISIVDGVVYYKYFLGGLGLCAFYVGLKWIFRNNE